MTNRLFIAEKPSLGKVIAAELGIVSVMMVLSNAAIMQL